VWATVFGEKNERSFSRRFICDVLEARAMEMMEKIGEKLEESGYLQRLPAGLVLTGGCSQLPGFTELGREVLNMPVRVGAATARLPISGLSRTLLSPTYATSVGLLLWGMHEDARAVHRRFEADPLPTANAAVAAARRQAGSSICCRIGLISNLLISQSQL
jgi:cell division ATPase FtsA